MKPPMKRTLMAKTKFFRTIITATVAAVMWLAAPSAADAQIIITPSRSIAAGGGGSGDVVGPAGATDNAPVCFDGATGLLIKECTLPLPSTAGGTGNGFTKFTGPTTAERTFTLPNSDATLLYSGGDAGTPSAINLANGTALPVATGISGLGTGVATWAATPSISNFFSALTGEASGVETFLTTPSLANFGSLLTGEGTGVITALGVNVGSAGAFVVNGGALGTPSSGSAANLTSIPVNQATGDLPFANLAQCATGTILSNLTGGTADVACNTYNDVADALGLLSLSGIVAGDLIVGDGADSVTTLAIGAEGKVLKVVSGVVAWGDDSTGSGSLGSNLSSSTNDITSDNNAIKLVANSEDLIFTASSNKWTFSTTTGVDTLDFGSLIANNLVWTPETSGTLTVPMKYTYNTAVCQGSTASLGLSALTSLAPTATCITGTNVTRGWAQFPDSDGNFEVQGELKLPADFTGAVDISGVWRTAATTGDIKLYVTVACTADAEVFNDTWVAAGNVVETAKGTTLQHNDWSITGLTTTGCAAGETLNWRVYRQRTDAADTLSGTFDLGPITLTIRRGM